jgi:hypothetical protein
MIETHNHVLETPQQFRARQAAYYQPATGDVAGAPFELPPIEAPGSLAQTETKTAESKEFKLFGNDGFDVFDVLDMINPLQHIPVISTIYRRLTGDELSPGARVVGATLLGGPIGAALAMADSAVEYKTGKDAGANVYAALFGNEGPIPDASTAVASAPAAAPWQDPDLVAQTVTTGGGTVAFVAAAAPDLSALGAVGTAAGTSVAPIAREPKFVAAPWKNPDLEPLSTVAAAPKSPEPQAQPLAQPVAVASAAERPMPSEAAKAQAINALAAMPTSQTTAAVAELARSDPRPAPRHHMAPPAGDIPRGAAASLSRKATSAYANSMPNTKPTKAEVAAAADSHNANAVAALDRSTTDAQSDWMLDAMQRAMAKYEATAKLRTAANGQDGAGQNTSGQIDGNSGGLSVTR